MKIKFLKFPIFVAVEKWSIDAVNLVGIFSLFLGLLYVVQLAILKDLREQHNRLILGYFGVLSFIIFFFEAYDNGFANLSKYLIPLLNFAVLAIGPSVFVYVKSITSESPKVPVLRHYILAIAVMVLSLLFEVLRVVFPTNVSIATAYIYLTVGALTAGFILQNAWYIYHSILRYNAHKKKIVNIFSYNENVKLGWLGVMIYGYFVFFVALVLASMLDNAWSEVIFDLVMLSHLVYIGYHSMKQTTVYKHVPEEELTPPEANELIAEAPVVEVVAALADGADDENQEVALKERAVALVESEKLYMNQDINIYDLANALETNSKYLSQAINRQLKKSFIVFINEYRVEEAKRMLLDAELQHLTIEGIGQNAGFKSKSAFNAAFKKMTNATPSAFRKQANA